MNETMKMIEIIRKNNKKVRLENLKRAELKRKEDRKEKLWIFLSLTLFNIGAIYFLYAFFNWLYI